MRFFFLLFLHCLPLPVPLFPPLAPVSHCSSCSRAPLVTEREKGSASRLLFLSFPAFLSVLAPLSLSLSRPPVLRFPSSRCSHVTQIPCIFSYKALSSLSPSFCTRDEEDDRERRRQRSVLTLLSSLTLLAPTHSHTHAGASSERETHTRTEREAHAIQKIRGECNQEIIMMQAIIIRTTRTTTRRTVHVLRTRKRQRDFHHPSSLAVSTSRMGGGGSRLRLRNGKSRVKKKRANETKRASE